MKGLYLLLDIATLFFPLALSFDKKVAFVKSWKNVFFASLIVGLPFLVWDILFTKKGVWGFNADYLVGFTTYNLPIEEVLFFFVVPFACIFIYECTLAYFSEYNFQKLNEIFFGMIIGYIVFITVFGYHGAYAQSVILSSLVTVFILAKYGTSISHLPLAFLISLGPFLLVNGVLTGGFTEEPIVWYNDAARTPFRIFTIPVEDILYSFTLIGLNIFVFERMKKRLN